MPRRPTRQHRTALGSFIEEWRRNRGLTQADFQQSLDVDLGDRYVSKVESGQIRRPNKEFFEALSRTTGVAVEELRRSAGEPAGGAAPVLSPREPRILFGHCLWGVPVLLAAASGLLEDFKVASLRPGQNDGKWIEPKWIEPKWVGPDKDPAYLRRLAQDARPMNAADVLSALEDNRAEIGILPGDVARRQPHVLERVGVVFDGSAGMVLLSPDSQIKKVLDKNAGAPSGQADASKEGPSGKLAHVGSKNTSPGKHNPGAQDRREQVRGSITTREIGHGLWQLSMNGEQPFVGLDEATVAREVYKDIEHAGREAARGSHSHIDFDSLRWHVRTSSLNPKTQWLGLEDDLRGEHPHGNLFGLITWEPVATWIADAQGGGLTQLQILALHGLAEWPRHFTFEVVIRKSDAQDSALLGHVKTLMSTLWNVTSKLSSLPEGDLDTDTLEAITAYFSLGEPKGESKARARGTLSSYRYVTYRYEDVRPMLTGRRLN